jgi:predicted transposase/invertase (TIGR01784 family)
VAAARQGLDADGERMPGSAGTLTGLVQAALQAAEGLPTEQVMVYFDLVMASVSEALRRELEELMQPGQYEYQSEFARRYFGEGREKGREEGRLDAQQALARRLLARGMSVAEVAALTDLPEDQVHTLH